MRLGLIVIGVLFLTGGLGAIFRPAPYYVTAHPNPNGDIAFQEPKAEGSMHKVNSRIAGYAAAGFGVVMIVAAVSLKKLVTPKPHGKPLHHDISVI